MGMERDDLKEDRELDPHELDVELLNQPAIMAKWVERAALAKFKQEEAELALEVGEARMSLEAAQDPNKYGIAKPTVESIKAGVKSCEAYLTLATAALEARRDANMLAGAVRAIEMRKSSLRELTALHGLNYFAGPDIPHDLGSLWKQRRDKARSLLGEGNASRQVARKRVSVKR